jgi:ABC-type sugar transport system substrate-binding protein
MDAPHGATSEGATMNTLSSTSLDSALRSHADNDGATNALSTSTSLMAVRNLHKWYSGVHALKGVSLDFKRGEVVGHELNDISRRLLIEGTLDAVLDQNPAAEAMRSIEIILRHYHRDPGVALPQQIPVTVLLRENLPLSD